MWLNTRFDFSKLMFCKNKSFVTAIWSSKCVCYYITILQLLYEFVWVTTLEFVMPQLYESSVCDMEKMPTTDIKITSKNLLWSVAYSQWYESYLHYTTHSVYEFHRQYYQLLECSCENSFHVDGKWKSFNILWLT